MHKIPMPALYEDSLCKCSKFYHQNVPGNKVESTQSKDEPSINHGLDNDGVNIANEDISLHETSFDDMLLYSTGNNTTPRQDYEGKNRKRMKVEPACMYCDISHPFHKVNLNPLNFKRLCENFQKQIDIDTKAQNASRMTSVGHFVKHQEDISKQTQQFYSDISLDRIQMKVNNGQEISPIIFSMLLNLVKIRDKHYMQILRILSRSCQLMNKNSPQLIREFFTSKQFFQQFINTNMIVDEIWMLRRGYPERLQEWKVMHSQIFIFRGKLLKFLEKQFGRGWTQELIEKTNEQRKKV